MSQDRDHLTKLRAVLQKQNNKDDRAEIIVMSDSLVAEVTSYLK